MPTYSVINIAAYRQPTALYVWQPSQLSTHIVFKIEGSHALHWRPYGESGTSFSPCISFSIVKPFFALWSLSCPQVFPSLSVFQQLHCYLQLHVYPLFWPPVSLKPLSFAYALWLNAVICSVINCCYSFSSDFSSSTSISAKGASTWLLEGALCYSELGSYDAGQPSLQTRSRRKARGTLFIQWLCFPTLNLLLT